MIKGGWARYYHMRSSDDLQIANKNTISQARYRWRDLNGNRDYDPGEVNLDPNGADFIDRTLRGIGSAFGGGIINPDTTQRYQDELLLSVEQQLTADWAVPGHWRPYRRQESMASSNALRPHETHNIPIPNLDPGPDGVLGTPDDTGNIVTYYDLSGLPRRPGSSSRGSSTTTRPIPRSTRSSFRLPGDTRRTGSSAPRIAPPRSTSRWSRTRGTTRQGSSTPRIRTRKSSPRTIPGMDLPRRRVLSVQYGILGSVNFSHESGAPWARRVELSGGRQIPTLVVNVEPIGTRRLDNLNLLDIRGEKRFSVGSGQQVVLRLNLPNALNKPTVLGVQMQSGPRFNTVTSIVSPRILEWGLSSTGSELAKACP